MTLQLYIGQGCGVEVRGEPGLTYLGQIYAGVSLNSAKTSSSGTVHTQIFTIGTSQFVRPVLRTIKLHDIRRIKDKQLLTKSESCFLPYSS